MFTHEDYIHGVYEAARKMVSGYPDKLAAIDNIKLVYGLGSMKGARGVTYYQGWKGGPASTSKGKAGNPSTIPYDSCPAVEICAFGQSDWTQVAGTTIHELGHVIAGYTAGHGHEWKEACELLGLRKPKAAGMKYHVASFDPKLRALITALPKPQDGSPIGVMSALGIPMPIKPKACGAAIGVKGGKSRGVGSGSRLVKCSCGTCGYTVRTTGKWLAIAKPTCPDPECKGYQVDMIVED